MYTDGLNEATDSLGNELGMEGVKKIVAEAVKLQPKAAADYILNAAQQFSGNKQLSDDISIVVLKKK
jgi:serine phosphatase RsbU (regulator of sigma subunit)